MLTKTEFISRLKRYSVRGDTEWIGQTLMIEILLEFFNKKTVPEHENGGLLKSLLKYVVYAMRDLKNRRDQTAGDLKKSYRSVFCRDPFDLTQVAECPIKHRHDLIRKLGLLLTDITGRERCREEMESYCLAQDRIIEQYFDRFLKEVYCRGLAELANRNKDDMLEGGFGTTTLLIRPAKDSRTIIFWRKPYYYRGETSIVVFSRRKPVHQPAGFVLKEVIADSFYRAVEMIEEVIIHWPVNPEDQKASFEIIKPPFH